MRKASKSLTDTAKVGAGLVEPAIAYMQIFAFFRLAEEDFLRTQQFDTPGHRAAFIYAVAASWNALSEGDRKQLIGAPGAWRFLQEAWPTLNDQDRATLRRAWDIPLPEPIVVRS